METQLCGNYWTGSGGWADALLRTHASTRQVNAFKEVAAIAVGMKKWGGF